MTPGEREAARAALSQGRAVYARLDQIRGPEDAAADIIDLWKTTESTMRAMFGGSVLSGQALVRELRQRNLLDLDQANALASFWDARSRVDSVNYKPTLTDVGHARAGYNQLSEAVEAKPKAPVAAAASPPPADTTPVLAQSIEMPVFERQKFQRSSMPLMLTIAALVVVVLVAVGYLMFGRSSYDKEMNAAIAALQSGQIETARAGFVKVSHEYPQRAEPHVFLARISRTDGDLQTAHRELETAIRTDPTSAQAMREMGLLLLAENNAALAVNFFIRAIKADTADPAAKGYLGCALIKQHRFDEGQKFLARAGSGSWTSCTPPASSTTAIRPAP